MARLGRILSIFLFFVSTQVQAARNSKYPDAFQVRSLLKSPVSMQWKGPEGYLSFCESHFDSNLKECFEHTSAALGKSNFEKLNWGQLYRGSIEHYKRDQGSLSQKDSKGFLIYSGVEGYIQFAKDFYGNSLSLAYGNASAALTERDFAELAWGNIYGGSIEQRQRDIDFVQAAKESKSLIGSNGYIFFSNTLYGGNMNTAFKNASAALSKNDFQGLNWGKKYDGSTVEFQIERSRVLNQGFEGPDGYVRYTDLFFEGITMEKAFSNVSAVLTDQEFKELRWGKQYRGSTTKFLTERSRLFENGKLLAIYQGLSGYLAFSDEYYDRKMQKAFSNVSAVLSESEFSKLGWKVFFGTTDELRAIRAFLSFPSFTEINFSKWQGKTTGLNSAVHSYMLQLGHALPFNQAQLAKVRQMIRASVSAQEIMSLNWESSAHRQRSQSCEQSLKGV